MRNRIRVSVLFLIFIVAMSALSACSSAPESPEPGEEGGFVPALDTETAAEIRVVGNYKNFESLEEEFERFRAYYPETVLTYTYLDSYYDTIVPALKGEDAPDIFCTAPWMASTGELAPLFETAEDLSDESFGIDLGCVREGLLYRDREGKVPMVPVFSTTYGMLVNEDIFRKEKIPVPESLSEFREACEALRKAGYPSPFLGNNTGTKLVKSIVWPYLSHELKGNPEAVERLNSLDASAGELLIPSLNLVRDFLTGGNTDLKECSAIEDEYEAVILRFFEGDVPMMFVHGDVVSGTAKRESLSEAYTARPFSYGFYPIPVTEEGGFFLNTVAMAFAVNQKSGSLNMTNEFMRFLVTREELNRMARNKRLVTATKDFSLDGIYASFGRVPPERTIFEQEIGIGDDALKQIWAAAWNVGNGVMSVEEAAAAYGSFGE